VRASRRGIRRPERALRGRAACAAHRIRTACARIRRHALPLRRLRRRTVRRAGAGSDLARRPEPALAPARARARRRLGPVPPDARPAGGAPPGRPLRRRLAGADGAPGAGAGARPAPRPDRARGACRTGRPARSLPGAGRDHHEPPLPAPEPGALPRAARGLRRRDGAPLRMKGAATALVVLVATAASAGRFDAYFAELESPDRARWQQPERVVETLRLRPGMTVADLHERALPLGPPAQAKASRAETQREAEAAGFRLRASHTFLPYQYFLEFTR